MEIKITIPDSQLQEIVRTEIQSLREELTDVIREEFATLKSELLEVIKNAQCNTEQQVSDYRARTEVQRDEISCDESVPPLEEKSECLLRSDNLLEEEIRGGRGEEKGTGSGLNADERRAKRRERAERIINDSVEADRELIEGTRELERRVCDYIEAVRRGRENSGEPTVTVEVESRECSGDKALSPEYYALGLPAGLSASTVVNPTVEHGGSEPDSETECAPAVKRKRRNKRRKKGFGKR